MRILYVLNSGEPGGMEQHVLDLVRGFKTKNYDVHVWCASGDASTWYIDAGAMVTIAPILLDIDPLYIASLTKYLKTHKIDVVHAHELKACVNALIAAKLSGTKTIITHTHTPISEWQINSIVKFLNIKLNSFLVNLLSTKEIALTQTRKEAKLAEGIKENRLEIIPNGIDVAGYDIDGNKIKAYRSEIMQRHNIPQDAFIFGNISRLTIEKGHEVLIRAFHRLLEYKDLNSSSLHLLIAGGGKMHDYYTQLIDDLGLAGKVTLTGRFSDEDKIKLYSSFDSFVFPSVAEGFGIVLLEAMCMKLPIICSNLDVLEEVGGSTVFSYFETNDFENLAEKMYSLYSKRDRLESVGEDSFKRAQELYSLDAFIQNYEELYENLISR